MASVELLKQFEQAAKAEAETRIELDDNLDKLSKAEKALAKAEAQVENARGLWNQAERIKSDLFDRILAVQNL